LLTRLFATARLPKVPVCIPKLRLKKKIVTVLSIAIVISSCGGSHNPDLFPEYDSSVAVPPPDRPAVIHSEQRILLWGDLHIHTGLSTDAYLMGTENLPDDAYVFAKGGEIRHPAGYGIRADTPLDFAAVTDHAEMMGVLRASGLELPLQRRTLRERLLYDSPLSLTIVYLRGIMNFGMDLSALDVDPVAVGRDSWRRVIDSAEKHNEPGKFTTFIAYEWSSTPDGKNLHRNVIYRGSSVPDYPYSSLDSEDPRDLWAALDHQRGNGMDSLAIPHNPNASDGLMFDTMALDGSVMSTDDSRARMRNEPVAEIFQIKGSSETHPQLSPEDEFSNFEILDKLLVPLQTSRPQGSYIRDALKKGIAASIRDGINPFRYGVVGSSDSHTASSPYNEADYHGKFALGSGSARQRLGLATYLPDSLNIQRRWTSGGLVGVWAEDNTRESIFDAIRRRETVATSGTRICVRFFGGWNYDPDLSDQHSRISIAEKNGVPMGGKLPPKGAGSPSFAVWALKDPRAANLDRIQIVKLWIDRAGAMQEKVFDAALSDGRRAVTSGETVQAVGNTVDPDTARYTNSIGSAALEVVWTDPDFDADMPAAYYARVIEIPTPRWSTYDAVRLGIAPQPPIWIQERAVTSAIWYEPAE